MLTYAALYRYANERSTMKTARITHPLAVAALAIHTDDDISAAEKDERAAAEVAGVDRLLEDIDRELIAQQRAEHLRLTRAFNDQVRARRAHRRANRAAVRALPTRLVAGPDTAALTEAA